MRREGSHRKVETELRTFIEVPNAIGTSTLAANVGGDRRAELLRPASHGLVCEVDAAFGEKILDVEQAQREAMIVAYSTDRAN